jgi:hypothetical protein
MSDEQLGYCLLVGGFKNASGDTLIPVHWVGSFDPADYPDYPSDNWFAELSTTSPAAHYPQLEIGRLPVIDSTDLAIVLGKILSSEPLPDADGWSRRVFLTSGWNINTANERDTLENTFTSIANIAAAADLDTLLFRGDWKPQSYDFISENCRVINSGTRFVYYGVHGEPCQMAAPPAFSTSSLSCLTNLDSLPIFFTGACKTASFDSLCPGSEGATACVGAELLRLPSGGVVGFLGPADAGGLNTDFGGCVDAFRSWVKYHSPLLGDGWLETKLIHYGYFCQSFTLLGDPAFHVLLRESGVGYCDLGVRQDDLDFEPDVDVRSPETAISIPVSNLTPYRADAETLRVHFYAKSDTASASQWMLIDSTFVGPIEAWSADTASVLWNLAEIEPGYYNVKVVLDPRDDLREAYENNNVALTTRSIGLSLKGFPVSLGAEPATSPTFACLIGGAYILCQARFNRGQICRFSFGHFGRRFSLVMAA